jgi:hypothetical protein
VASHLQPIFDEGLDVSGEFLPALGPSRPRKLSKTDQKWYTGCQRQLHYPVDDNYTSPIASLKMLLNPPSSEFEVC